MIRRPSIALGAFLLMATEVAAMDAVAPPTRFERVAALGQCTQAINKGRSVALIGSELPFHCTGVHWRPLTTGLPVSTFTGQRVANHTLNPGAIFMTFTPAIWGKIISVDATSIADGIGGGNVTIEILQSSVVLCSFTAACAIADNTPIPAVTCADNTFVPGVAVQIRYGTSATCTQNPAFIINGVFDPIVPSS